jgi:hypothetical protein
MINPQKGIDLMNNTSIIIRILFAVRLFQHLFLSSIINNVPPSFWDMGAHERGNAHGGHVGAPPNFREIQGDRGTSGSLA